MRLETTYRHAYASGTRRGCPCCLRVNPFTKRQERRLERRLAERDTKLEYNAVDNDFDHITKT